MDEARLRLTMELAHGKKMATQNMPSRGPPTTPNIDSAICRTCGPMNEATYPMPTVNSPNITAKEQKGKHFFIALRSQGGQTSNLELNPKVLNLNRTFKCTIRNSGHFVEIFTTNLRWSLNLYHAGLLHTIH